MMSADCEQMLRKCWANAKRGCPLQLADLIISQLCQNEWQATASKLPIQLYLYLISSNQIWFLGPIWQGFSISCKFRFPVMVIGVNSKWNRTSWRAASGCREVHQGDTSRCSASDASCVQPAILRVSRFLPISDLFELVMHKECKHSLLASFGNTLFDIELNTISLRLFPETASSFRCHV